MQQKYMREEYKFSLERLRYRNKYIYTDGGIRNENAKVVRRKRLEQ